MNKNIKKVANRNKSTRATQTTQENNSNKPMPAVLFAKIQKALRDREASVSFIYENKSRLHVKLPQEAFFNSQKELKSPQQLYRLLLSMQSDYKVSFYYIN